MHIALCTPVSLNLFEPHVRHEEPMPSGFTYPFAFFLTMRLLEAGHRVTVVTSACDVPLRTCWQDSSGRLTVIATPRRRPRYYCWDLYRREVRAMCAELRQSAPDLVHAQWTYEFADAGLSSGLPCLVTARDAPWLVAWHFKRFYRLYRAVYSSLYQAPRIRYFTSVSPHIQRLYRHEPFFRPEFCDVTPNGLEQRFFASGPRLAVRQPSAPCFVSVSGWSRLKNAPCLLRAFAVVRRRCPDAKLFLIGDGLGPGQKAETWAMKNGLTEGVVFKGVLPYREMLDLLDRTADICVHTTREESFSMVTLESMAKGIPVVGGLRSGGVPWLLDHGAAGVLVDIESPQAVAEGMIRLAEDRELYQAVAKRAYERAEEHFKTETIIKKYVSVYEHVLQLSQTKRSAMQSDV